MGGYFGLPGSADHFVPNCAGRKQFGFGSQALCFFGKAGFKGLGLFETSTQHDTTSCLRVLTVGFCSSDPNMQMPGRQFQSEQNQIRHPTQGVGTASYVFLENSHQVGTPKDERRYGY
jgi:hypothetical protein